eukprot:scaffold120805_cov32-Tisochrysis_lutea.AAC.1
MCDDVVDGWVNQRDSSHPTSTVECCALRQMSTAGCIASCIVDAHVGTGAAAVATACRSSCIPAFPSRNCNAMRTAES